MSIVQPSDNKRACFTALIGNDLAELAKSGTLKPLKGIEIFPMGLSPDTKTKATSDCGMEAIINLIPTLIQFSGYSQYRDLVSVLKNAGYKSGINLQALPYDWRLDYKENPLNTQFKKVIKEMSENTGKKVLIVAHSFGNLQVANNLWNMTQDDKDKYIARYIALAPPYLGSTQLVSGMIGYADNYMFNLYVTEIGITPKMFRDGVSTSKGVYNLMPTNTWNVNSNTDWLKAIKGRIQAEQNKTNQPLGTIMDIFPQPTAICNTGFKRRDAYCRFGLADLSKIGSINGESINYSNMGAMLDKYGIGYKMSSLWEQTRDSRFDTLDNLGVQVNIVFGATIGTSLTFDFKTDPREKTKDFKVATPTWVNSYGDSSVQTASALIPGIKWADDFNKNQTKYKPVNFIEICAEYNRRNSVFEPNTNKVTKNAYFGIACQCKGTQTFPTDGTECDHVKLVSDSKTVEFIMNSAIDWQIAAKTPTREAFETKADDQLKTYEEQCHLLTK